MVPRASIIAITEQRPLPGLFLNSGPMAKASRVQRRAWNLCWQAWLVGAMFRRRKPSQAHCATVSDSNTRMSGKCVEDSAAKAPGLPTVTSTTVFAGVTGRACGRRAASERIVTEAPAVLALQRRHWRTQAARVDRQGAAAWHAHGWSVGGASGTVGREDSAGNRRGATADGEGGGPQFPRLPRVVACCHLLALLAPPRPRGVPRPGCWPGAASRPKARRARFAWRARASGWPRPGLNRVA